MAEEKNPDLSLIAEKYANALIELGEHNNLSQKFDQELSYIKNTFDSSKDLMYFLTLPNIPLGEKKATLDQIFKDGISDYVLNILKLLTERNRIAVFPFVCEKYSDILNKQRNITIAEVITAVPVTEEEKSKVQQKLEKILKKSVVIDPKTDSDIIAGMIIKVDNKVIDGSIKTRLENFKKQLI